MSYLSDTIQFCDITIPSDSFKTNVYFKKLWSYIQKYEYDLAIEFIEKNQKELQQDVLLLIVCHIDLLITKKDFKKAKEVLRYYENLPYFSQKVEEVLSKMPSYIDDKLEQLYKEQITNNHDIIKNLSSNNKDQILSTIEILRTTDITPYITKLKSLIESYPIKSVRLMILLLLVEKKYDKPVSYLYGKDKIILNPKLLKEPFNDSSLKEYKNHLNQITKDQTLIETMIFLTTKYILSFYPTEINVYSKDIISSIYYLAKKYTSLDKELSLKESSLKFILPKEDILKKSQEIEQKINELN